MKLKLKCLDKCLNTTVVFAFGKSQAHISVGLIKLMVCAKDQLLNKEQFLSFIKPHCMHNFYGKAELCVIKHGVR